MSLREYSEPGPRRRRRGAELESALLDAAWQELLEAGFGAFSLESVAARARTSRAVLYRRWPSKHALVLAALVRALEGTAVPTPDTGSLRGDLVALLHAVNDARARLAVRLAAVLDVEDAPTLAELRDELARRGAEAMGTVLERARDRGEIASSELPRRVRSVPLALLGYQVLLHRRAATPEEITEIVDEVVVPLVRAHAAR